MQNSVYYDAQSREWKHNRLTGFIFMTAGSRPRPRFVGDNDRVYDWVRGKWLVAYHVATPDRVGLLNSLRTNKQPFYRARMITNEA